MNGEEVHSFRIPGYMLPAFFFKREKRPQTIGYFYVYDLNDNLIATIDVARHLQVVTSADFDGFGYVQNRIENGQDVFPDNDPDDQNFKNYIFPCGKYYIRLEEADAVKKYYSEVFEVVNDAAVTDGNELVLNGTFGNSGTSLANWNTSGSVAAVPGFGAQYTGGATGSILSQVINGAQDNDNHFYKVSFIITGWNDLGDPTRYVRVHFNNDYVMNSVYVNTIGVYTYYLKNVSKIDIHTYNGEVTFSIGNISVQKIYGHENHVSLSVNRSCKFPNSIDSDNYKYYNFFLFDARILAPEYGEVIKEDDNGDFEKVTSFVRPFKKHQLTPLLLPEPVMDGLAQLNTFDEVEIYDAINQNIFILNSTERLTKFRSIQQFETKTEWQGSDCYALATISFDENLALFDKCCDDDGGIIHCFDFDEPESMPVIEAEIVDGHFHISLTNTPALSAAFVSLFYKKQAIADYVDCDGITENDTNTGIVIPFNDFAADGIDYFPPDLLGYAYKFYIIVSQIGCVDTVTSAEVCPGVCFHLEVTDHCWIESDVFGNTFWTIRTDINVNLCGATGIVVELYDEGGAVWFEPTVNSYPIPDGASSPEFVFADTVATLSDVHKIRLKSGSNYSNEVTMVHAFTPCP